MLTKLSASSSKIPIRDLTPMFSTMDQSVAARRQTFSASFNPPSATPATATAPEVIKSKSHEKIQKLNEKNKELKQLVSL